MNEQIDSMLQDSLQLVRNTADNYAWKLRADAHSATRDTVTRYVGGLYDLARHFEDGILEFERNGYAQAVREPRIDHDALLATMRRGIDAIIYIGRGEQDKLMAAVRKHLAAAENANPPQSSEQEEEDQPVGDLELDQMKRDVRRMRNHQFKMLSRIHNTPAGGKEDDPFQRIDDLTPTELKALQRDERDKLLMLMRTADGLGVDLDDDKEEDA